MTSSRGIRTPFSSDDDELLAKYIATYNPPKRGRNGNALYQQLTENAQGRWSWAERHPWQAWRNRYVKDLGWFDVRIARYQRKHGIDAGEEPVRVAGASGAVREKKARPGETEHKNQHKDRMEHDGSEENERKRPARDDQLQSSSSKRVKFEETTNSARGEMIHDEPNDSNEANGVHTTRQGAATHPGTTVTSSSSDTKVEPVRKALDIPSSTIKRKKTLELPAPLLSSSPQQEPRALDEPPTPQSSSPVRFDRHSQPTPSPPPPAQPRRELRFRSTSPSPMHPSVQPRVPPAQTNISPLKPAPKLTLKRKRSLPEADPSHFFVSLSPSPTPSRREPHTPDLPASTHTRPVPLTLPKFASGYFGRPILHRWKQMRAKSRAAKRERGSKRPVESSDEDGASEEERNARSDNNLGKETEKATEHEGEDKKEDQNWPPRRQRNSTMVAAAAEHEHSREGELKAELDREREQERNREDARPKRQQETNDGENTDTRTEHPSNDQVEDPKAQIGSPNDVEFQTQTQHHSFSQPVQLKLPLKHSAQDPNPNADPESPLKHYSRRGARTALMHGLGVLGNPLPPQGPPTSRNANASASKDTGPLTSKDANASASNLADTSSTNNADGTASINADPARTPTTASTPASTNVLAVDEAPKNTNHSEDVLTRTQTTGSKNGFPVPNSKSTFGFRFPPPRENTGSPFRVTSLSGEDAHSLSASGDVLDVEILLGATRKSKDKGKSKALEHPSTSGGGGVDDPDKQALDIPSRQQTFVGHQAHRARGSTSTSAAHEAEAVPMIDLAAELLRLSRRRYLGQHQSRGTSRSDDSYPVYLTTPVTPGSGCSWPIPNAPMSNLPQSTSTPRFVNSPLFTPFSQMHSGSNAPFFDTHTPLPISPLQARLPATSSTNIAQLPQLQPADLALFAQIGFNTLIRRMSDNHGYTEAVVRAVFASAGSLREADAVLLEMRETAKKCGERRLSMGQGGNGEVNKGGADGDGERSEEDGYVEGTEGEDEDIVGKKESHNNHRRNAHDSPLTTYQSKYKSKSLSKSKATSQIFTYEPASRSSSDYEPPVMSRAVRWKHLPKGAGTESEVEVEQEVSVLEDDDDKPDSD